MSVFGTKRTFRQAQPISALGGKADIDIFLGMSVSDSKADIEQRYPRKIKSDPTYHAELSGQRNSVTTIVALVATKFVQRHRSQKVGVVDAPLCEFNYFFGNELCGGVVGRTL